ncbi:MAG: Flp pilus assembly complex ATPase component TadA [Pirellulales bacterium]|nr:Flp pilus assembly complex ATPase component TadA [Pirellulales bacterium]
MAFRFSFGKPPPETAPAVRFRAAGEDDRTRNINLLKARRSSTFDVNAALIHQAVALDSTSMQIDRAPSGSSVTLEVDGVLHPLPPVDIATATELVNAYKQLAGLSAKEARWRQSGQFTATVDHKSWECTVISSGVSSGERTQVLFDSGDPEFPNLAAGSLREPVLRKMRTALASRTGLVLFSAPPDSGMVEILEAAVRDSDRFQRSYFLLESSRRPRAGIENVTTRKFDGSSTTIESLLQTISKEHPDVLILPELTDGTAVDAMTAQPAQSRLALTGISANDAPEALLRALSLRCNASRFAGEITAVANGRLVRKLCVTCRQSYLPPPQVLVKLDLPIAETQALFRSSGRIVGERDEPIPCPACFGLGYRGRAMAIEWLEINDAMRATMLGNSEDHLSQLRQQARQAGMTPLRKEAVALIAQGLTSVQEISRVLKGE